MSTLGHVYRDDWHMGLRCWCHDKHDETLRLEAAERLRYQRPAHHEATDTHRESWSVVNPHGAAIHYGTEEEAASAARTGIY